MVIALAAITSSVASSQVTGIPTATSLDIRPGDRVRVVAPESGDTARIGTIAAIGDDGIVLRGERRDESLSIPFAHLRQLDVSQGRSAHALAGLGIGLAVGALAGAASFEGSYGPTSLFQSRGTLAAEGALVGAVPGALIGVVTGALVHTDRWRTLVPLHSLVGHVQAGVNLIPSSMGPRPAVRVAVRF
jgi:hypothetical protein